MSEPFGLLPHQASFVDAAMNSTDHRLFLLVAQAGLGKTSTLVALAQTLLADKPSAKLLVLAPIMVAKAYRDRLAAAGCPAAFVDGYRFREIRNAIVHDEVGSIETSIMMSLDDVATQDGVAITLQHVAWDLVVIDDAEGLLDVPGELLAGLSGSARRMVIATRTPDWTAQSFAGHDVSLTHWRPDEVVDKEGRPLAGPQPVVRQVRYSLAKTERHLFEGVERLCVLLDLPCSTETVPLGEVLRRQLLSSPATLESGLRTWTLQAVAASREGMDEEHVEPSEFDDFANRLPRDQIAAIADLASAAVTELDTVETDSKLEKLFNLLHAVPELEQPVRRRVCVVTSYRSTLFYLAAALEDSELRPLLLHSGMDAHACRRTLDLFGSGGGLLLATRTVLKRIELPGIRDLVIYEPPDSIVEAQGLVSRFDQLRRRTALRVHMLRPEKWATTSFDAGLDAVREAVARSRLV